MVNIFLLIELLSEADVSATLDAMNKLSLEKCEFASLVKLSGQKLVAQLDCDSYQAALQALLGKIAPTEGVVQTNVISAIRPTSG